MLEKFMIAINRLTGQPYGSEESQNPRVSKKRTFGDKGVGEFGDTASTVAAGRALAERALAEEEARRLIDRP